MHSRLKKGFLGSSSESQAREMASRYTCLDGVRVLTHISLIALHTSLLMTGHLPFDGELWQNVKTNYLFTTFQMGGDTACSLILTVTLLLTYSLTHSLTFFNQSQGSAPGVNSIRWNRLRSLK